MIVRARAATSTSVNPPHHGPRSRSVVISLAYETAGPHQTAVQVLSSLPGRFAACQAGSRQSGFNVGHENGWEPRPTGVIMIARDNVTV